MRAKVIVPLMALAVLAIAVASWLRPGAHPDAKLSTQEAMAADAASSPPARSNFTGAQRLAPARQSSLPDAPESSGIGRPTFDAHLEAVQSRVAELSQLGLTTDPHSLVVILSEFNNPDAAIRKAAISAAVDFGSRDAIPALQNALLAADDLKEKEQIQNAIDFLRLPSVLAQNTGTNAEIK